MKAATGWLVTLIRRICYAATIAVLTWLLASRSGLPRMVAMILDFPVAALGAISGGLKVLKGIDLFFGRGVGEFMSREEILLWHLRASLFVYVPLFYVVGLIRLRRRGRAAEAGASSEAVQQP